jgi:hypothetical protein
MSNEKDTKDTKEAKAPTPPSGQGGESPKSRPDYQDMWPPNPPADDISVAYGKRVAEVGNVAASVEKPK